MSARGDGGAAARQTNRRYPDAPRVGIGIVVLKGDEVLLVKRGHPPAQGAWSLPGGSQELGETAQAAARRELHEETGLHVGPLTLIGHVDSIHRDPAGQIEYHYTILDFAAHYQTGTPHPGDDVTALAWAKDLTPYTLWPEALRIIAAARRALTHR